MNSSNNVKKNLIISKKKITQFLEGLSDYTIYAPHEENGSILFKVTEDIDNITFEFMNSVKSPKHVLLPQTETLLRATEEEGMKIEEPELDEKNIVFGIRPCDARAIRILEDVFSGEYDDPYYLTRRKNTVLIGLACNDPHRNCFCTSVDGAPNATDGLDMLWTDIGEKYYVEVLTEKGMNLINNTIFTDASEEDVQKKEKMHEEAIEKITEKLDTETMAENLKELFDDTYWEKQALKCLSCGICTYLCPTCYCFDITDVDYGGKVKRVRTWDSCQFPSYTIQTSGHNPRPNRSNRLRNRIYHKYRYHIDNYDELGCVGCGRCITYCPADINLKTIIKELGGKKDE